VVSNTLSMIRRFYPELVVRLDVGKADNPIGRNLLSTKGNITINKIVAQSEGRPNVLGRPSD
jgi:hypothetical protein